MNNFEITIKDINALSATEVAAIHTRLSSPGRNMRSELEKRYITPQPGDHETIMIAAVLFNSLFVSWVGTRAVIADIAGASVAAQSVECFTDSELRQRGFALLGLQALISAGFIDRDKPVVVYREAAIRLADRCGCKIVILGAA